MEWTTQQQKTIDERGKNILVSAAAGSGKTAVLVERIKKIVTEEGVPIDRMLIVTFTNAAASEMREKIRKALKAKAKENPELKKQLELMPRASISTFHSFALDVIHHFFYLIDMEPDFSICDTAQSTVISEEAMDDLIENRFEADDPDFYEFLDWYGSEKSNDNIRDMIKSVHTALMALPEPFGTFDEKIAELELKPSGYMDTEAMKFMKEDICGQLAKSFESVKDAYELLIDEGLEGLADKLKPDVDMCKCLYDLADKGLYKELASGLSDLRWTTLRAGKAEKETYDSIRDTVAALRNFAKKVIKDLDSSYFKADLNERIMEIGKVSHMARVFQKLVADFDTLYKEKKREKKLVDFSDIEHCCLDILKEEGPAEFYREKFQHIFIDEYQDTSLIQEAILGRIKRENNLFMVGDIKQSIYKFRLAEPEIFKGKYEYYADCQDGKNIKIDLNRNFRSKPVIIDEINELFRPVMEGYDEDASLYPGVEYNGEYSFAPETKLVDISSVGDADEAIQDLKSNELEALEVCRIIKDNLGREYYDAKNNQVKKLGYADMVILMRSVSGVSSIYYDVMKSQGIPLYIDDNKGYFDTMEINVFMNLLSIIDNKYQDVPFISVIHSEIFGFSTDELAEIRLRVSEGSYVHAFIAYATSGRSELSKKCAEALVSLRKWKSLSLAMGLPEFLWKLLLDTDYYLIMGAMPDGSQRQANLRALIDKTENFTGSGQSSLYSFIRYIDTVKKNKVDMGQVKLLGENDDVVRIMTIHKSKGLEFPMVIVSGMGRKLMYSRGGSRIIFHKDIGLGMYLENPEKHMEKKTLPYDIILNKTKREEVEENVRVLYVALTRTREKLFLTAAVKDAEKFLAEKDSGVISDSSYLNLLKSLPDCEVIDCSALGPYEKKKRTGKRGGSTLLPWQADDMEFAQVAKRLAYKYPYVAARTIRAKYSVSDLNQANHEAEYDAAVKPARDIALEKPKFLQGERSLTMAEKGIIYHSVMKCIDFGRAEKEGLAYLKAATDTFTARGIFLPNEIEAIDLKKIDEFFDSDIGRKCAVACEAGKLYKEQPFNLKMVIEGEAVIVQGIIDCYFEDNDEIVLLDYKSNWIDADKPFEEEEVRIRSLYKKQMEIYGRALEMGLDKPVKQSYLYLFATGKLIEVNS